MTESETDRDSLPKTEPAKSELNISDAINKVISNPELMGMIGQMMSTMRSQDKGDTQKEESAPVSKESDASDSVASSIAPLLSSLQSAAPTFKSADSDRRSCLLRALKPYLSKERCEAIDQMITIGRISEIFRNLN